MLGIALIALALCALWIVVFALDEPAAVKMVRARIHAAVEHDDVTSTSITVLPAERNEASIEGWIFGSSGPRAKSNPWREEAPVTKDMLAAASALIDSKGAAYADELAAFMADVEGVARSRTTTERMRPMAA